MKNNIKIKNLHCKTNPFTTQNLKIQKNVLVKIGINCYINVITIVQCILGILLILNILTLVNSLS